MNSFWQGFEKRAQFKNYAKNLIKPTSLSTAGKGVSFGARNLPSGSAPIRVIPKGGIGR